MKVQFLWFSVEILKMPINKNEITKEMIEKAMQCKTAEELMALAKTEGVDITREEAEAYLAELADFELDSGKIKEIAGGLCTCRLPDPRHSGNKPSYI